MVEYMIEDSDTTLCGGQACCAKNEFTCQVDPDAVHGEPATLSCEEQMLLKCGQTEMCAGAYMKEGATKAETKFYLYVGECRYKYSDEGLYGGILAADEKGWFYGSYADDKYRRPKAQYLQYYINWKQGYSSKTMEECMEDEGVGCDAEVKMWTAYTIAMYELIPF